MVGFIYFYNQRLHEEKIACISSIDLNYRVAVSFFESKHSEDSDSFISNFSKLAQGNELLYAIQLDDKGNEINRYINPSHLALFKSISENKKSLNKLSGLDALKNRAFLTKSIDFVTVKIIQKSKLGEKPVYEIKLATILPFNLSEKIMLDFPYVLYGILLLLSILILLSVVKRKKIKDKKKKAKQTVFAYTDGSIEIKNPKLEEAKEDIRSSKGLDLLSMEIDRKYEFSTKEYTEEELNRVQSDGWINLFNGWDIDDWEKIGNWYVNNNVIIGTPWQSSIVRKDVSFLNYEFEFQFKKSAGNDGAIAIFEWCSKSFAWVLGGWRGTRSEVIGIKETESQDKIEKGRWYCVKIVSLADEVKGYLDSENLWSLKKDLLTESKEQEFFLKGIGVGLWSTMAKFKEIRILKR